MSLRPASTSRNSLSLCSTARPPALRSWRACSSRRPSSSRRWKRLWGGRASTQPPHARWKADTRWATWMQAATVAGDPWHRSPHTAASAAWPCSCKAAFSEEGGEEGAPGGGGLLVVVVVVVPEVVVAVV